MSGFISQFKKYSPFSTQVISCDFDSPPQLLNTTGTGDIFDITIPRHGDLVRDVFLRFGLTPPTNIQGFNHAFVPSVYMFEKFELIIGNTIVETLHPEFINIYYNVFREFSKKKGNTLNMGPLYSNRDTTAFLPDDVDLIVYNTNRTYTIHLPFYFSFSSSQALPLCALYNQEVIIRCHMKGLQNIVQLTPGTSSPSYVSSLDAIRFTHIHMDIDYVYLSNEEFNVFASGEQLRYMYTETQQETFSVASTETVSKTFRSEVSNPVVEMFMYIIPEDNVKTNVVDKHDRFNTSGHTIQSISLSLDGIEYIDEIACDSTFLSQLSYLLHHSSVFEHNTLTNNMYVYNYSFSLEPESCCPSGTVNMNLINNKLLRVNFPSTSTHVNRRLFVLYRSVNILVIENGVARTLFKNVN